jgi:hypothetical protein
MGLLLQSFIIQTNLIIIIIIRIKQFFHAFLTLYGFFILQFLFLSILKIGLDA